MKIFELEKPLFYPQYSNLDYFNVAFWGCFRDVDCKIPFFLYILKSTIVLKKEEYELKVLEEFLPKEATKEDVIKWLNENYPNGITQKEMGPTIGKIKNAFERVDGKMVSECVKNIIKN